MNLLAEDDAGTNNCRDRAGALIGSLGARSRLNPSAIMELYGWRFPLIRWIEEILHHWFSVGLSTWIPLCVGFGQTNFTKLPALGVLYQKQPLKIFGPGQGEPPPAPIQCWLRSAAIWKQENQMFRLLPVCGLEGQCLVDNDPSDIKSWGQMTAPRLSRVACRGACDEETDAGLSTRRWNQVVKAYKDYGPVCSPMSPLLLLQDFYH